MVEVVTVGVVVTETTEPPERVFVTVMLVVKTVEIERTVRSRQLAGGVNMVVRGPRWVRPESSLEAMVARDAVRKDRGWGQSREKCEDEATGDETRTCMKSAR